MSEPKALFLSRGSTRSDSDEEEDSSDEDDDSEEDTDSDEDDPLFQSHTFTDHHESRPSWMEDTNEIFDRLWGWKSVNNEAGAQKEGSIGVSGAKSFVMARATQMNLGRKTAAQVGAVPSSSAGWGRSKSNEVGKSASSGHTTREGIWGDRGLLPLHPDRTFRLTWSVVSMLLIIHTMIFAPFYLCIYDLTLVDHTLWTMEWFITCFFATDILLNFATAYWKIAEDGVEETKLITDPWMIAKNYFRTWILLDLIATIPFELFMQEGTDGGKFAKVLKVARLLRLLRVMKLKAAFQKLFFFAAFDWKAMAVKDVTITLAIVAVVSHWVACIWCTTANWEYLKEYDPLRFDFSNARFATYEINTPQGLAYQQWLIAFTWAGLCLTIGTVDPLPQTEGERIVLSFACLLNIIIVATIIGSLTRVVMSTSESDGEVMKQLKNVGSAMNQKGVPRHIVAKIRNFLAFQMNNASAHKCLSTLESTLSPNLFRELRYYMLGKKFVESFPPLKAFGTYFSLSLMQVLSHMMCSPQEIIAQEGHVADSMIFLVKGTFGGYSFELADDPESFNIKERVKVLPNWTAFCWYGERQLLSDPEEIHSHIATIQCLSICELLVLHKDDFDMTVGKHADWKKKLKVIRDTIDAPGADLGKILSCARCQSRDHYGEECPLVGGDGGESRHGKSATTSSRLSLKANKKIKGLGGVFKKGKEAIEKGKEGISNNLLKSLQASDSPSSKATDSATASMPMEAHGKLSSGPRTRNSGGENSMNSGTGTCNSGTGALSKPKTGALTGTATLSHNHHTTNNHMTNNNTHNTTTKSGKVARFGGNFQNNQNPHSKESRSHEIGSGSHGLGDWASNAAGLTTRTQGRESHDKDKDKDKEDAEETSINTKRRNANATGLTFNLPPRHQDSEEDISAVGSPVGQPSPASGSTDQTAPSAVVPVDGELDDSCDKDVPVVPDGAPPTAPPAPTAPRPPGLPDFSTGGEAVRTSLTRSSSADGLTKKTSLPRSASGGDLLASPAVRESEHMSMGHMSSSLGPPADTSRTNLRRSMTEGVGSRSSLPGIAIKEQASVLEFSTSESMAPTQVSNNRGMGALKRSATLSAGEAKSAMKDKDSEDEETEEDEAIKEKKRFTLKRGNTTELNALRKKELKKEAEAQPQEANTVLGRMQQGRNDLRRQQTTDMGNRGDLRRQQTTDMGGRENALRRQQTTDISGQQQRAGLARQQTQDIGPRTLQRQQTNTLQTQEGGRAQTTLQRQQTTDMGGNLRRQTTVTLNKTGTNVLSAAAAPAQSDITGDLLQLVQALDDLTKYSETQQNHLDQLQTRMGRDQRKTMNMLQSPLGRTSEESEAINFDEDEDRGSRTPSGPSLPGSPMNRGRQGSV